MHIYKILNKGKQKMHADCSRNFGIYIHVPWCRRRCVYCDFYFEIGKSSDKFPAWVKKEWQARALEHEKKTALSLYFGGGTPSLLHPNVIRSLIEGFQSHLLPNAEITLEANPEDLNQATIDALKQAGITRLSLGVQSLEPSILKYLGRKHTSEQAKECIAQAASTFDRVSVDLIVGVSSESLEVIRNNLEWICQQGVGHISTYLLTLEEKTPLFQMIQQKKRTLQDDDQQAHTYEWMQQTLQTLGFFQYEISSFALPGQESRHNRLYWSQGTYIGLGPGAHSMRIDDNGGVVRRHNQTNLSIWSSNPSNAPFLEEILSPEKALLEALAFGIRDMGYGLDPIQLSKRHQTPLPNLFYEQIRHFENDGFVREQNDKFFLTPTGARFSDFVSRHLLNI